jgi:hypothetical protein
VADLIWAPNYVKINVKKMDYFEGYILEAGAGIEPAMKALQAPALPLCYPA